MMINVAGQEMALRDWIATHALAGHPGPAGRTSAGLGHDAGQSSSATLHLSDDQLADGPIRLADALLRAGGHAEG